MADRSASLAFILSLQDKVTAPLGKVKMGFSELADQSEKHIKTIGLGLGGLTAGVVGIRESMEPALEVNRALGDVRSLGVAEDALSSLNAKSLEFAVNYGENAQEFVASAYLIEGAIKGLAGNQLAVFTNTSNLLAKATKTDAETMGEYVGTLYNLQKSQADAMGKGEWVERLGGQTALAVQLFRTSGAAMKDAFKEAGAIATTAGVDLAEQMAVIGTLSSTMEGGDAGGRYKAFFENIGAASDKLGIKFTDQQGKILPMMTILDKLQGKFGDLTSASAGAKLLEAFGGEGAQVIGALAKDTSRLRNGIEQLGKVRGLENAENMARAMVDPWQQWASLVEVMRVVFGQVLIPVLTPFMNRMIEIGKTLVRWSQLFPNITRVIGITALTIMGIVAAMSLLTVVVGGIQDDLDGPGVGLEGRPVAEPAHRRRLRPAEAGDPGLHDCDLCLERRPGVGARRHAALAGRHLAGQCGAAGQPGGMDCGRHRGPGRDRRRGRLLLGRMDHGADEHGRFSIRR